MNAFHEMMVARERDRIKLCELMDALRHQADEAEKRAIYRARMREQYDEIVENFTLPE